MQRSQLYILLLFLVILVCGNLFSRDGVDAPFNLPPLEQLNSQERAAQDSLAHDIAGLLDSLSARFHHHPADSASSPLSPGSISADSLSPDSIAPDTVATDSVRPARPSRIRREKVDLDHKVDFSSKDSMIMVGRKTTYMYGESEVEYGDLKLQAAEIQLDMDNSEVYACGMPDSVGDLIGLPIFTEGGSEYESETMRYNFRSKRGYITDVITQQGEGYLTGGQTKKTAGEAYYIQNGRYTTCSNHENPDFYIHLTRAKVIPKKNIVTGPAYMVLAGLPLPLAVPFGYFPFTDSYASGVIVPTFGDDYNRGFYLSDGGYYFAINDNIDLALTGEIFTKGSWGLSAQSSYRKRYKYSGNFHINYLKTIYGEKSDPDYATGKNFQVIWSHSQDAKANPNMTLSASVNFTTSGYTRSSVGTYYTNSFTENTKSSTINLGYRFPNSKWAISTSLNVSQRTKDSTLAVSFPNLNITMSQTNPFKRKHAVGAERWYEKIRISYTGQFQNSLTANQDQFFKKSLIKDWRNGMKHNIPISATFSLFNYFNLTPAVNLTDRMYTQKVRRQWDPAASAEIADTTYSFYNVWDFNASLSLDTKIYGFFQPLPFLGDRVKMIRHVLTPTISFSGAPDFGSSFFGYYDSYTYTDRSGRQQTRTYSMFPNALFGVPGRGRSGVVSVSLANNVEMKVRSDNDSIGEKKISLIENLSIGQSYNFAADSLNWSNINTSLLLRLSRQFNLNLSATWDVYTYQLNSAGNPVRVNIPRWKAGKGWGRLSSTGTSFSYTFNNDTFSRNKDKNKNPRSGQNNPSGPDPDDPDDWDDPSGGKKGRLGQHNHEEELEMSPEGYMVWQVPWSLSVNYSINYSYGKFNKQKMEYDGKVTQNLSLSGNLKLTKNWEFSATASYDFDMKKIAYMNVNITRLMHCFRMRASVIPVGPYKSYNFHISVDSSLLQDLKYDKRSSQSNGVRWY